MDLRRAWAERRYWLGKRRERLIRWVVWRLPREVVMWAYIRVGAHATTGCYGNTVVPELGMMDALSRWDTPNGGDPAAAVAVTFPADGVPLAEPAHWSESFPVAGQAGREAAAT